MDKGTVVVKIIEKTYFYDYRKDTLEVKAIHTEFVETSPREALDLVIEVNTSMTEGETLLELSSKNCKLITCFATIM